MSGSDLRLWIQRQLGDPIVEVELESEHIDQAIENAMEWWASIRGWCREAVFDIIEGQREYDLSGFSPAVRTILNVWFPDTGAWTNWSAYPGFLDYEGVPFKQVVSPDSHGRFSTIVQEMTYLETASRILSGGMEWDWDAENKKLVVSPGPPRSGKGVVFYEAVMSVSDLAKLLPRDKLILKRWALADAKEILGRIRGKYDSMPAAQGSVSLDGRDLISEARDEKQQLEEQLVLAEGAPGIVVG